MSCRGPRVVAAFVISCALAGTAHAQSALADRIQSGDRRAALAMIDQGVDVNRAQPDGTTPLHWAAQLGSDDLVAALLEAGASANAVNRHGVRPHSD